MTERDKDIINWVNYAKKMIARSKSDRKEDWVDKVTITICEYYEKIKKIEHKKAYLAKIIKFSNPIYEKHHKYECEIPTDEEGNQLDDLVFVDNNTPDKGEEDKTLTTIDSFKLTKNLLKELKRITTLRTNNKKQFDYGLFWDKSLCYKRALYSKTSNHKVILYRRLRGIIG